MKIWLSISCLIFSLSIQAKVDKVTVEEGFIYKPLNGTTATAGYGLIKNSSDKTITIEIIKAEGFKAVELHETISKDGMMKMQKLETVTIQKNDQFQLTPGGNHIMLFSPEKEFNEGDTVKLTFKNKGQEFTLPFKVKLRPIGKHKHH